MSSTIPHISPFAIKPIVFGLLRGENDEWEKKSRWEGWNIPDPICAEHANDRIGGWLIFLLLLLVASFMSAFTNDHTPFSFWYCCCCYCCCCCCCSWVRSLSLHKCMFVYSIRHGTIWLIAPSVSNWCRFVWTCMPAFGFLFVLWSSPNKKYERTNEPQNRSYLVWTFEWRRKAYMHLFSPPSSSLRIPQIRSI